MGKPFATKIRVSGWGNGGPGPGQEIEVLVDTGAAYTSLPRTILQKLQIPIRGSIRLRLANGQIIEREYGPCEILVMDRWVATMVLFAADDDIPLLGMNTMDEASVDVDVANRKLIPVQAIQA